jgi:hypothetical protein
MGRFPAAEQRRRRSIERAIKNGTLRSTRTTGGRLISAEDVRRLAAGSDDKGVLR